MVKALSLLISEFARAAGLSSDAVRLYVRRGLLDPVRGARGGSSRYQIFSLGHLETARMIRLAQSLGFTLREIAALNREFQTDGLSDERVIAILSARLNDLDDKATKLALMTRYLREKLQWLKSGRLGAEPTFASHACEAHAAPARAKRVARR
jgi:MerR family copper efflux transcriptional regulator